MEEVNGISFSVCHFGKHDRTAVKGIEIHNQRERFGKSNSNPDIRWESTHENYDLHNNDLISYNTTIKERIDALQLRKAVRKDAVVMAEIIISSDKEFFEKLTSQQSKTFFEESYQFLAARYGKENVIGAVVHMDETTPHLHFSFVPVTADGRLSCRDLMNRKELILLHDTYHKMVGAKWNLQRGEKESDAQHVDPQAYKKKLENENTSLEEQIAAYKTLLTSLTGEKLEIPPPQALESVRSYYNRIKPLREQFKALEIELKETYAKNADLKKENSVLYGDIRALKEVAGKARSENNQYWNRIIDKMKAEKSAREDVLRAFEKPLPELLPLIAEKVADGLETAVSPKSLLAYLEKYNIAAEFGKNGIVLALHNGKQKKLVSSIDATFTAEYITERLEQNHRRLTQQRPVKNAEKALAFSKQAEDAMQKTPKPLPVVFPKNYSPKANILWRHSAERLIRTTKDIVTLQPEEPLVAYLVRTEPARQEYQKMSADMEEQKKTIAELLSELTQSEEKLQQEIFGAYTSVEDISMLSAQANARLLETEKALFSCEDQLVEQKSLFLTLKKLQVQLKAAELSPLDGMHKVLQENAQCSMERFKVSGTPEDAAVLNAATDELSLFALNGTFYQNLLLLRAEVVLLLQNTQEIEVRMPGEKLADYLTRTEAMREACKAEIEAIKMQREKIKTEDFADGQEKTPGAAALLRLLQPLQQDIWEHLSNNTFQALLQEHQQQRAIMDSLKLLNLFLSPSEEPRQQQAGQQTGELSAAARKELLLKAELARS